MLLNTDKMLVDATTGGSLLDKTTTEARKLLCKLAGENPNEAAGDAGLF